MLLTFMKQGTAAQVSKFEPMQLKFDESFKEDHGIYEF